ncbi:MAG: hypothetical protein KJP21_00495 [Bacteroidia bacterium]|nr:hypothetical protein [Bacteroidia bacterium]
MLKKGSHTLGFLLVLFLLVPGVSNAATVFTSTGTGNWSTSFSSSGSGSPLIYIIQSGDTITVDVNGTSGIDTIRIFGTLNFNNGKKLDLTASGVVELENGGSIGAGNGGSKFRFPGGTSISGPFSLSGPLEGTGTTGGAFVPPFLPVDWLGVQASIGSDQIEVVWQTGSELNNNYFVIQYSETGSEWSDCGTVYSLSVGGNSDIVLDYSYSFDKNVLSFREGKCFLRIKQVDFDNEVSFSNVKMIKNDGEEEIKVVQLNNNLFTTNVKENGEEVFLKILTLEGSTILNEILIPTKKYKLVLPGLYIILFESKGEITSRKIIVH